MTEIMLNKLTENPFEAIKKLMNLVKSTGLQEN
jgi:hypothetical protein